MRVLQISSDRSKRGGLVSGTPAARRQEAYASVLGHVDDIGFSLRHDDFQARESDALSVHPTNSRTKLLYGWDAIRIARRLPHADIISAQDPFETGLTALGISRLLHMPLHVQVHTDFLSPEYARHSFLNRIRVWIAGFVLRRASRVRIVSGRIQESIGKKYTLRAPISVLPIFADVERLKQVQPDTALAARFAQYSARLLVVARLEPEKHARLALESFAQSAPHTSCLIIVGEGSERAMLESRAQELGISERVFFEGSQDSAPYYAVADLLLVTSRYEGYGLVIIEALAAGKPVLSTDVGIAREAGAIVASPEKFSQALAQWFASGPRTGELKNYPYRNFEDYVQMYCTDIAACI